MPKALSSLYNHACIISKLIMNSLLFALIVSINPSSNKTSKLDVMMMTHILACILSNPSKAL